MGITVLAVLGVEVGRSPNYSIKSRVPPVPCVPAFHHGTDGTNSKLKSRN